MKVGAGVVLDERPRGGGHLMDIHSGCHLNGTETQTFGERSSVLNAVHRGGDNRDASLAENEGVCVEVNQLLTAVRSPVTPVEQDNGPGSGAEAGQVDSVAVHVLRIDGGESLSHFEWLVHDLKRSCQLAEPG